MEVPLNPLITKLYRDVLRVPDSPSFIETKNAIVPVAVLEPVKTNRINSISGTSVSGTGWLTIQTAPSNKYWRVQTIEFASASGTWTANSWRVYDPSVSNGAVFDNFTAAGSDDTQCNGQIITLSPNMSIQIYINSVTVAGTLNTRILIEEWDSY